MQETWCPYICKIANANSVLTGLSRVVELNQTSMWLSVPLFAGGSKIDRGNDGDVHFRSNRSSNDEEDDNNDNDDDNYGDFYHESILEHLSYEQLSVRQPSRRRAVKFQFSWYEILPHGESEDRKFSGRLYQDKYKRSIQLQSFMVSHHASRAQGFVLTDRQSDCGKKWMKTVLGIANSGLSLSWRLPSFTTKMLVILTIQIQAKN